MQRANISPPYAAGQSALTNRQHRMFAGRSRSIAHLTKVAASDSSCLPYLPSRSPLSMADIVNTLYDTSV